MMRGRVADSDSTIADVVVIGAGPAGIAAAVTAAERGMRVVVLDHGLEPGGQIWRHRTGAKVPRVAARWLARLDRCSVEIVRGASVVDARPAADVGGFDVLAERAGTALRVHAARIVLATGARELFIPF
ncbi:MAG TPA: FAD-dependent oxidoreductase, partial [Candidatus Elarobacter sp.]|nr:FAD-dependent oxidoreductase [Candidatus Elarobacter sp.]